MYAPCRQRFERWPGYLATVTRALSNGYVHCESLRSFWAEEASPSHPKAERRQSKSAIFTPFYLCWSKNRKADQPDQKITLCELRQYSSRSRLVGRNPESYCDHRVLLLRVR